MTEEVFHRLDVGATLLHVEELVDVEAVDARSLRGVVGMLLLDDLSAIAEVAGFDVRRAQIDDL